MVWVALDRASGSGPGLPVCYGGNRGAAAEGEGDSKAGTGSEEKSGREEKGDDNEEKGGGG